MKAALAAAGGFLNLAWKLVVIAGSVAYVLLCVWVILKGVVDFLSIPILLIEAIFR